MADKKLVITIVVALIIISATFYYVFSRPTAQEIKDEVTQQVDEGNIKAVEWREAVFEDIATGELFKVSDFAGKIILLESFAVWCPICKIQQDRIKSLHEELGDSFISISLDTDPNEDAARVQGHIERNGYDWLFAVSPAVATKSLIDELGIVVVNAPSAPVVLICEDQSARLLPSGVKSVDKLKAEIAKGC